MSRLPRHERAEWRTLLRALEKIEHALAKLSRGRRRIYARDVEDLAHAIDHFHQALKEEEP